MSIERFNDDLIWEHNHSRNIAHKYLSLLEPRVPGLKKTKTKHWVHISFFAFTEYLFYLLAIGGIYFTATLHTQYPFSVLFKIYFDQKMKDKIGTAQTNDLALAVYGVFVLCIVLFFFAGRMAGALRKRQAAQQKTGAIVHELVNELGVIKFEAEAVEKRHGYEFPEFIKGLNATTNKRENVNDVPNPGFGAD